MMDWESVVSPTQSVKCRSVIIMYYSYVSPTKFIVLFVCYENLNAETLVIPWAVECLGIFLN